MRWLQITFFALGSVSFLAALFFRGTLTGEDLWKAGIAIMLGDVVLILLWPRKGKVRSDEAGGAAVPSSREAEPR